MKIASYNLRSGGKTVPTSHLSRLLQDFELEIVCAQESFHPSKYFDAEEFATFRGCVHSHVPHGKWGSAILSRNYVLEPLALPELSGWVVAAKVPGMIIGGVAQPVIVASLHAPSPGPYEPAVSAILNQLEKVWDRTPLILAGDFNLTTALRHASEAPIRNTTGERKLLQRLRREFGVVNAWQTCFPNQILPQTLRWTRNPSAAYHCDAIFLSHHFLPHLVSATVESDGDWATMSDHNPIIATLA